MNLPSLRIVVLDTETTGFIPRTHRIMEFASARVENGNLVEEYDTLITVPEEVPPHIQIITRIKPPMLEGKPTFDDVRETIAGKLANADLLVGQNLGFDLGMLKGERIDVTNHPWVDTSLLAALLFPELRSYSLQYLSSTLGLHHDPPHRALGDVRATLSLFEKIWERLLELPPALRADAKRIMEKSSDGYKLLFAQLPDGEGDMSNRTWPFPRTASEVTMQAPALDITPAANGVTLHEESLQAEHLQSVIDATAGDTKHHHFIAVKNLEATLRKVRWPDTLRVLFPPSLLLDPEAVKALEAQPAYTADESTLLVKITWFAPKVRSDIAVHGGEKDTWNGKMACTEQSPAYRAQFQPSSAFLLDQRQLFQFLANPQSAAHDILNASSHIIIDDASMLEDNATKAFGAYVGLDDLRAAAQGNDQLMQAVDMAVLWAEKSRNNEDLHFLAAEELDTSATKGLIQLLEEIQASTTLQPRMKEQLAHLKKILDPQPNPNTLRWIECRLPNSLSLHEAPEYVDQQLQVHLFSRFATTLVVPSGAVPLPEIIPQSVTTQRRTLATPHPSGLAISFPEIVLEDVLKNPPAGKTIALAGSKHLIEKLYVKYTEELEDKGIALICQGMSGGMNRMEAEFLASDAPAIMILTPWMYEGSELPAGTVDHLILDQLPFDHPNSPVFQKRKDHYKDWFGQYSVPRLTQRLFRLMRTFCRHRTATGDLMILDKRLKEKAYGKGIVAYLSSFATAQSTTTIIASPEKAKVVTPKEPPAQQSLF